jgi:hypothetical protein
LTTLATVIALTGPAPADETVEPIGEAIADVPIFDAHMHYNEPPWGPYAPVEVVQLMDESGVALALVSSTPDKGTLDLFGFAPSRFILELQPYRGDTDAENWTEETDIAEYLQSRLERHPHKGLGEIHIHELEPRHRNALKQVASVAVRNDLPVHIHSGPAPVELMFELEPSIKLIWAHGGKPETPGGLEAMLDRFPSLYADTSLREPEILADWDAWEPVIRRNADRLMIGTDTWVNGQWYRYRDLVEMNRQWLSRLPRDMAEKIAYQNAEVLFDRKLTDRH